MINLFCGLENLNPLLKNKDGFSPLMLIKNISDQKLSRHQNTNTQQDEAFYNLVRVIEPMSQLIKSKTQNYAVRIVQMMRGCSGVELTKDGDVQFFNEQEAAAEFEKSHNNLTTQLYGEQQAVLVSKGKEVRIKNDIKQTNIAPLVFYMQHDAE